MTSLTECMSPISKERRMTDLHLCTKVEPSEESETVKKRAQAVKRHKCNLCLERFAKFTELQAHHTLEHPISIKADCDEDLLKSDIDDDSDNEDEVLEIRVIGDKESAMEEFMKVQEEKSKITNNLDDKSSLCCVVCDNGMIMSKLQLIRHYKKHEKLFKTINKEAYMSLKKELNIITRSTFYCHICKDGSPMTKWKLKCHYKVTHHIDTPTDKQFFKKARSRRPRSFRPEVFRCEICSEESNTQDLLDKHVATHADQYSCDTCDERFKKLIDYTFHIQTHSDDKLYKCPLCQFVTDKGYLVKSHLYSVHEQFKKYKCNQCNKGFAIFTHFQEHKYFHTGEKPFQCDICGQKFMYTRYLNSHKVQMHLNGQKGIECKICHKMYSHRNSLNTHMKSHTGVVSVCDVCGKTFSSNEKLRLHYRIHTGEKPYKCDYCDKSFKTSSYRAEHERIHTGEKPYECPYCGKGFSQRTSMVIHSRGHTGEKPYLCHLCSKAFAAKSMVTIHLRSCKGGDMIKKETCEFE